MTLVTAIAVGFGSAAGAMVRSGTDSWVRSRATWPAEVATLIVNVVGSAITGALLSALLQDYSLATLPLWATVVIAGFCGGLTTFASLAVQIEQRSRQKIRYGITIASAHLILGFGSAAAAWSLTRWALMMGT